jgi:NTE family protein
MPYLIQYFVNGLGRDAIACADLMSYLLFTPNYTRALIDIGYHDAERRIEEIEEFLYPSNSNGNGRSHPTPKLKLAPAPAKRALRLEE